MCYKYNLQNSKSVNYNGGNIPDLSTDTDYDVLLAMKTALDGYNEMIENMRPELNEGQIVGILKAIKKSSPLIDGLNDLEKLRESLDEIKASLAPINGLFSMEQNVLASKHQIKIVQSYWQDLLTLAATKQGKKPPVFDKVEGLDVSIIETDYGNIPIHPDDPTTNEPDAKPIIRPRRNKVKNISNILSVLDEYFVSVERDQAKKDTIRKLKKGIRLFVELMGDLPLQDIEQTTVYSFMDKQQELRPNISARVLKDNNWSLRSFFKFCIERGYVKINPLADIDVGRRGIPVQTHLNYSRDELHTIFSHNWKPQERLLLSVLITTGMRLSEAANLSWERFSEDHDGIQGMRCFSLLNTNDEIVTVKNKGSMRIIPLHPDLVLPPKGTGRLFDYKMNEDGLASHDAGRAINPTLQKLVPHPQKMAHSFRGTLKELLRDAGVSKEISDFYTGHSSGDVAGTSYGGVGVDTRYIEISKVRHPWLKYKSLID